MQGRRHSTLHLANHKRGGCDPFFCVCFTTTLRTEREKTANSSQQHDYLFLNLKTTATTEERWKCFSFRWWCHNKAESNLFIIFQICTTPRRNGGEALQQNAIRNEVREYRSRKALQQNHNGN
eukprot:PhF_6_TR29427/c0_g1_i1/m.43559